MKIKISMAIKARNSWGFQRQQIPLKCCPCLSVGPPRGYGDIIIVNNNNELEMSIMWLLLPFCPATLRTTGDEGLFYTFRRNILWKTADGIHIVR